MLSGLLVFWYWADKKDYFKADYNELTKAEYNLFTWQDDDDEEKLKQRYRQHCFDSLYIFPRQKVTRVKLFRNTPMISALTSKTLKKEYVDSFVTFFSDTTNFDWGETTWGESESEYYCRFYNSKGKVIGKIYFCLDGCGMTSSKPFAPSMKFGSLSETGLTFINEFFRDKTKWE